MFMSKRLMGIFENEDNTAANYHHLSKKKQRDEYSEFGITDTGKRILS